MHDATLKPAAFGVRAQARTILAAKIAAGLALLALAAVVGRYFSHHLPAIEDWVEAQGPWAYLWFVGAVVLLTSLFVPDTLFALVAGALFGVIGGTTVMVVGCLLTAVVDYALARLLLQDTVRSLLARNPKLAALARAVNGEGLKFQFLLRLTPINPVTVSYILGATDARFATFFAACLGLVPNVLVEVYFGYVAKHVANLSGGRAEPASLHTALTIAGLVVCAAMLYYIIRVARRALAESEAAAPGVA